MSYLSLLPHLAPTVDATDGAFVGACIEHARALLRTILLPHRAKNLTPLRRERHFEPPAQQRPRRRQGQSPSALVSPVESRVQPAQQPRAGGLSCGQVPTLATRSAIRRAAVARV